MIGKNHGDETNAVVSGLGNSGMAQCLTIERIAILLFFSVADSHSVSHMLSVSRTKI